MNQLAVRFEVCSTGLFVEAAQVTTTVERTSHRHLLASRVDSYVGWED
jgi:hypothetical protein